MLSSSARRLQLTKERQHLTVRKKVRWCRAIPFQHSPKGNVIFKNARISIPTTQVFGKYPRMRQICPQMEKVFFLKTWTMNWGSAKATNHCGTFMFRWEYGWNIGLVKNRHGKSDLFNYFVQYTDPDGGVTNQYRHGLFELNYYGSEICPDGAWFLITKIK